MGVWLISSHLISSLSRLPSSVVEPAKQVGGGEVATSWLEGCAKGLTKRQRPNLSIPALRREGEAVRWLPVVVGRKRRERVGRSSIAETGSLTGFGSLFRLR